MIALPSRSGRTRARSSVGRQLGDPLLEGVVGRRQRRRAPPVAGRGVRAHQLVQPGQQVTGVGDVPADGGVGPLAAAVAVEAQVQEGQPGDVLDDLLRSTAAPSSRLRTSFAPTTSWWWKDTRPPRLVPAGGRLADVVQQRGQPQHQVGRLAVRIAPSPARSPGPARSASACRRPCAGGARRSPSAAPAARAARRRRARYRRTAPAPRRGASCSSVLDSSACTRSGVIRASSPASAVIAATTSSSGRQPQLGDEPDGAQHPQRVVGEGVHGGSRACAAVRQQVPEPAERIGDRAVGAQRDRHRVDREVAPGQVVDQRVAPGDRRGCATRGRTGRPGTW